MNKRDIKDRMDAIDNRLKEFPTIVEKENRQLTDAETKEKNDLITERASLKAQLDEIESRDFTPKPANDAPKSKFSLLSAIRSIVNGGRFEGDYADEVREMAGKTGLEYSGQIQMKAYAPEKRTLDGILTAGNNYTSNTYNGGKEMVAEDVLPIIEALYNETILARAGANFYNGLRGNAKIPVMGKVNFGFKAENAAADNVTPTMAKVDLTPQRLTGFIYLSKQLLNQSSPDVERTIRNQISTAIAAAFEAAVLGYGSSPHNGIMNGAAAVTAANLAYSTVLDLAASLYGSNFRPTFVVDPTVAALLKQKPRLTYGNRAVMDDGMVDDAPTFITNNLVAAASTYNALACADFTRLHVGTWGDLLDLTVDPYSRASYGEIVLTLNYYCDWGWDSTSAYAVKKIGGS